MVHQTQRSASTSMKHLLAQQWAGTEGAGVSAQLGHSLREQEAREERQRIRREQGPGWEDEKDGSFDDGDPYTTNLYVGNLAPDVDEEGQPYCMQSQGR